MARKRGICYNLSMNQMIGLSALITMGVIAILTVLIGGPVGGVAGMYSDRQTDRQTDIHTYIQMADQGFSAVALSHQRATDASNVIQDNNSFYHFITHKISRRLTYCNEFIKISFACIFKYRLYLENV